MTSTRGGSDIPDTTPGDIPDTGGSVKSVTQREQAKKKQAAAALPPLKQKIFDRLKSYFCFSKVDIERAFQSYDIEYIKEILDEIKHRIENGTQIRNIRAYTFIALRDDYRKQKSLFDIEREEKFERTRVENETRARQATAEREQADREAKQFAAECEQFFASLDSEQQRKIDAAALQKLKDENEFIFQQHARGIREQKSLDEMPGVRAALLECRNSILSEIKNPKPANH